MIRGETTDPGSPQITINGNGFTIDAQDNGRVFFVESGTVAINYLTIANALAKGGEAAMPTPPAAAAAAGSAPGRQYSSMPARW